ncbi:MAG: GNAT family N-acetyltransferase [Oscillospiraceae bacterium]|jgi:ribosomal protein S18 acetylase RimI-like enzyme|nr:GNAT family N-acetyltransferase [Oscillospiraceae bacterium]
MALNITYTAAKSYTAEQLRELFSSVGWLTANYPNKLVSALEHSETVFTAWDGEKLVGLINALDDGVLTAYVHFLLVHPDYQGLGIGKELLARVKERYSEYLYLMLVSDSDRSKAFYIREGFRFVEGTAVMAIQKPVAED